MLRPTHKQRRYLSELRAEPAFRRQEALPVLTQWHSDFNDRFKNGVEPEPEDNEMSMEELRDYLDELENKR